MERGDRRRPPADRHRPGGNQSQAPSHSRTVMPAWRRISFTSEPSMPLPLCGLGMRTLEGASYHELMPPSGSWSRKTKFVEFPNQLFPGDRAGHSSCGLDGQTNPAHSRDGVAVADFQYQPLLKDFLKYQAALPQRTLTRPHAGQARNLAKTGTIL
jgi:hypothetical protein